MEAIKLKEILKKHKMWLNDEKGGERADLSGANLIGANLSETTLKWANLNRANLRGADLRRANLRDADLSGADLSGVNLNRADLSGADLSGANLSGVNLNRADLSGAYLSRADINFPIACPEEGSFIAYKKALFYGGVFPYDECYCIVKLLIPEDAKRSSATTRKCRCNKAKVLSVTNLDGTYSTFTKAKSNYDSDFIYEVGKTVEVENFDDNRWNECAPGIHFFITRQEAVEY